MDPTFELHGPALYAFAVILAALVLNSVGDAWARVIECRRRSRNRDRELAVLEAYHASKDCPRTAPTTTPGIKPCGPPPPGTSPCGAGAANSGREWPCRP